MVQNVQIRRHNTAHNEDENHKAGKTFDKTQHPFMIKALKKLGLECTST
jgi:hypothetical protein